MSTTAAQARAVLARFNKRQQGRFATLKRRAAQALARQVRIGMPVVTGQLAATLRVQGNALSVGSAEIDAAAVEYGTSRQRPRPFLRPAVTRFLPDARLAASLTLK